MEDDVIPVRPSEAPHWSNGLFLSRLVVLACGDQPNQPSDSEAAGNESAWLCIVWLFPLGWLTLLYLSHTHSHTHTRQTE